MGRNEDYIKKLSSRSYVYSSMYYSLFQKTTLLNFANVSNYSIWFILVMFYHDFLTSPHFVRGTKFYIFLCKSYRFRLEPCYLISLNTCVVDGSCDAIDNA